MNRVVRRIPLSANAVEDVRRCRDWIRQQHRLARGPVRISDLIVAGRGGPDEPPAGQVIEWLNVLTFIVEEFANQGRA